MERTCKKHGETEHTLDKSKRWRCKACRVDAVVRRRRKVKQLAIEYKGSKCHDCEVSFDYPGVYEFHHTSPEHKDFAFGAKGYSQAWAKVQLELDKCVMLCANCHRIRHAKDEL